MNKGLDILKRKFGGETDSTWLDANLCQLEFLINKMIDGSVLPGQKKKDIELLNETVAKNIELVRSINATVDDTDAG